jgi:hypothetical protein
MPEFDPFRGLRYTEAPDLSPVLAPPYDVIDDAERVRLEARSDHNAVRVELPQDADGVDRYTRAGALLAQWTESGVLARDDGPTLTAYRMTYSDEAGTTRHTVGVLGALGIADGALLPHEHTTPKAKDDRLNLLRASRTNVSPIWGLTPARGLSALLPTDEPPLARATDDDGDQQADRRRRGDRGRRPPPLRGRPRVPRGATRRQRRSARRLRRGARLRRRTR